VGGVVVGRALAGSWEVGRGAWGTGSRRQWSTGKHFTLERFGLTAQLRCASVSIPSNIGEGWRRKKRRPYVSHLEIALGSQAAVDVQAELAKRLNFLTAADYDALLPRIDRIGRMLNGLISSLQPHSMSQDL
jgi:four helix bundle protein